MEQQDARPEWWLQLLDGIQEAQDQGIQMYGQVPPRATGILMGLTASLNPFTLYPSFLEISTLTLEQKVETMKDPEFRSKILSEKPISIGNPLLDEIVTSFNKMFRLGEPANYEPHPDSSVLSESKKLNLSPQEIIYDMLLEKDGKALIYHPLFNYEFGNLDHVETMLKHPYTVFGLGDAGAHCGAISDASFPTTLIQHWGETETEEKSFL